MSTVQDFVDIHQSYKKSIFQLEVDLSFLSTFKLPANQAYLQCAILQTALL
jgi:hypothetical protein